MSVFEDHRLRRTDLTIVHDSPLTGAGPDVALFRKLEDCKLSGFCARGSPLASHMAAARQVFMFAFSSCYSTGLKCTIWPWRDLYAIVSFIYC